MGSDDHYPEERAGAPRGRRRRSAIDRSPGDQRAVRRLRRATTGYVTVAERPLDPADFPGAPPENLVPGSMVFTMTAGAGRPAPPRASGGAWTPGASWRRPDGPGSSLAASRRAPGRARRATRTPRRYAAWAARRCRPRRNGSGPRAAGSTARRSCGVTSPSGRGSGWRTSGTATSRGGTSHGYGADDRRSARSRPTGSACTTWLATCGSGPRTGGRRTPCRRRTTVLRPGDGGDDSLDPAQPQFRSPAQGGQGRLVPVRRQLLPALPPGGPSTADDRHRDEPRRLPMRHASPGRTAAGPGVGLTGQSRRITVTTRP